MRALHIISLLCVAWLSSCTGGNEEQTNNKTDKTDYSQLAAVPPSWVDSRVAKAKERLTSSDAGAIVWNAMEAHGGLKQWYSNGPVRFFLTTSL